MLPDPARRAVAAAATNATGKGEERRVRDRFHDRGFYSIPPDVDHLTFLPVFTKKLAYYSRISQLFDVEQVFFFMFFMVLLEAGLLSSNPLRPL